MKKRFLFCFIVFISGIASAQENGGWTKPQINYDSITTSFKERYKKPAQYCTTYAAFKNNQWIEVKEVVLQDFKNEKVIIDQSDQFRFAADSKDLEKTLKNKAVVVLFGDSLFFNCKKATGKLRYRNGYVRAYRFQENKLCIPNSGESFQYRQMSESLGSAVFMGGLIGGLIGGAIVGIAMGGANNTNDAILIMNDDKDLKKIDTKMLESLLSNYPEYLEEYMTIPKKQKTSARVVMYFLKKMNLILPN